VLPATTLVNSCYGYMFNGCTNLRVNTTGTYAWRIPQSGTGTTATGALTNMLTGTGGTVTGTPFINTTYYLDVEPVTEHLTFEFYSDQAGTIPTAGTITPQYTTSGSSLEYSADGGAWTPITSGSTTAAGQKIRMRGTGRTGLFTSANTYTNAWTFSTYVKVTGNLNKILDYTNPPTTISTYSYACIFANSPNLISTSANLLPAIILAQGCYQGMFQSCTNLTTAPALPATALGSATSCYQSMFAYCSNLITPPALPATTLAAQCYTVMFSFCTSLVTAPALPATTLTTACYDSMFFGCTALTTVPNLPALVLTSNCYYGMFNGCTSLAVSISGTYAWRIPTSGTGTIATNALINMLYNTAGDNIGTPAINTTYYLDNPPV